VSDKKRLPIRVLIADDEAEVRDAYRQILLEADMSSETAVFHNLRERLFSKAPDQLARNLSSSDTTFTPVFCEGAEAAVAAGADEQESWWPDVQVVPQDIRERLARSASIHNEEVSPS